MKDACYVVQIYFAPTEMKRAAEVAAAIGQLLPNRKVYCDHVLSDRAPVDVEADGFVPVNEMDRRDEVLEPDLPTGDFGEEDGVPFCKLCRRPVAACKC